MPDPVGSEVTERAVGSLELTENLQKLNDGRTLKMSEAPSLGAFLEAGKRVNPQAFAEA